MPDRFLEKTLKGLVAIAASLAFSPAFATELKIGGTGVALGGMEILGDAFEKKHPDVEVTVLPSLGSSGGIRALIAGAVDLAVSARDTKPKESADGVSATLYATTPLALVTSLGTPASDIATAELAAIYAGVQSQWEDGSQIRLVLRPKSETATSILKSLSSEMENAVTLAQTRKGMFVASNDQDNADALEDLVGSLGVVALGQIATEDRRLKVLLLDGVLPEPGKDSSRNRLSEVSLYVVRKEEISSIAEEFLSFLLSAEGQDILRTRDHATVQWRRGATHARTVSVNGARHDSSGARHLGSDFRGTSGAQLRLRRPELGKQLEGRGHDQFRTCLAPRGAKSGNVDL